MTHLNAFVKETQDAIGAIRDKAGELDVALEKLVTKLNAEETPSEPVTPAPKPAVKVPVTETK